MRAWCAVRGGGGPLGGLDESLELYVFLDGRVV